MKQYQDIVRKYPDKVVVAEFCDWCGNQLPKPVHAYEYNDFHLYFVDVHTYPGCGSKRGWQVEDMCYPCSEKLRKLLKDAGIKISNYEEDWG